MMRRLPLVLYTALALGATPPAVADPAVPVSAMPVSAMLVELRTGEMRKLVVHPAPRPVPEARLLDAGDVPAGLEGFRGRVVVLNFWATWCAPCRDEMPSLAALEAALGGPDFAVVPVATGRNPVPAIRRFYAEAGAEALPILRDPSMAFARGMGVMGLPVTVILDREGREVGRLTGHADWATPEAMALIGALVGASPGG
jgi:thiol-disulfide isomerase/thioredoxin